jgi:hypothetical protein
MTAPEPTMYCRDCGYVLDGLPQPRCPECGREFDPHDPRTFSDGVRRPGALRRAVGSGAFWLGSAWALFLLGLTVYGSLFAVVLAAVVAVWRKKHVFLVAALVLSPFAVCFLRGALTYITADGRLRSYGNPTTESQSIDLHYRCERFVARRKLVSDCHVLERELMNRGLEVMIEVFGPMRGSYPGPYPSKAEVQQSLAAGVEVSAIDLGSDAVSVDLDTFRLDAGVGRRLLKRTAWEFAIDCPSCASYYASEYGPIQAAVIKGSCLVLLIPMDEAKPPPYESSALMVVIDTQTGRPFAYYTEGGYQNLSLPRWTKR